MFERDALNVNQSIPNNTKTHTLMAFDTFVIKGSGGKVTIDSSGTTLQTAHADGSTSQLDRAKRLDWLAGLDGTF